MWIRTPADKCERYMVLEIVMIETPKENWDICDCLGHELQLSYQVEA